VILFLYLFNNYLNLFQFFILVLLFIFYYLLILNIMSNPQTFYTVGSQGGIDLSGIFQPYTSGVKKTTGYKIPTNNSDLSDIFQPLSSGGTPISYDTGYKVNNGNFPSNTDLSSIFAAYNPLPYTITGGTYTKTTDGTYNYILTFTSSSSIVFNSDVGTINYTVVGGGAGGYYGGYIPNSARAGGTGGGGGQVITGNSTFSTGTTFTLTVGIGGTRGNYVDISGLIEPTNGNSSIISTKATANGGTINTGGLGGAAGSGTSNGNPGSTGSAGTNGYTGSVASPILTYLVVDT
jgi:hypothetical protein